RAVVMVVEMMFFFFSSRRRHTRSYGDWSSDVCSSDLVGAAASRLQRGHRRAEQRVDVAVVRQEVAREEGQGVEVRDRAARAAREIGRASCRERGEVTAAGRVVEEKTDSAG